MFYLKKFIKENLNLVIYIYRSTKFMCVLYNRGLNYGTRLKKSIRDQWKQSSLLLVNVIFRFLES